tara:strand:+ start:45 stop:629 length:585 start_codon:yes stop_codon:yes gene_type:complete
MKYKNKNFIQKYLEDLNNLNQNLAKNYVNEIEKIIDFFVKTSNRDGKIIFIGNGGSASICSHVSVDLSKNAKIKSINFNESDLITCLSNDYGYENYFKEALNLYCDKKKDLVVMLSCSGNSPNLVNAAKFCKKNKIKFITLTSQKKTNKIKMLNQNGINIWIDSSAYNQVEILFNVILLVVIDAIIGKTVYPPN